MKTTAIICEYNPFHNGHEKQLKALKQRGDAVIALMSGSHVQRGGTAILPKRVRAEAALSCGADLVLELPYPWCGGGAEQFAFGAISLLSCLRAADGIFFGSKQGDINELSEIADKLLSDEYGKELSELIESDKGKTAYPRLAQKAFENLFGRGFPTDPNDILGVEYIKAIKRLGSSLEAETYRREDDGFSAAESRKAMLARDKERLSGLVPERALEIYEGYGDCDRTERAESAILFALREATDGLAYEGAVGGLSDLIKKAANGSSSLDEIILKCSKKRYTNAGVRRAITAMVLKTTPDQLKERPEFTVVLAANGTGRRILAQMRKTSQIEILTKPSHGNRLSKTAGAQFRANLKAERFALLTAEKKRSPDELLKVSPIIDKND